MAFLFSKQRHTWRILLYFSPFVRQCGLIFMCIIVVAGLNVLPPLCIRAIVDQAIPQRNLGFLSLLGITLVAINIATSLIGVGQIYLSTRIGQSVTAQLRQELFERLQTMSVPFYSRTQSGEITSRINNDVNAVQNTVTTTLVTIVSHLLTTLITLSAVFILSWRVGLFTIIIVPALLWPMRAVGLARQRVSRLRQEKQAELTVFLQEKLHFSGMLLAKTFGQERADSKTFAGYNHELAELNMKLVLTGQGVFLILSASAAIIPALIYIYGGKLAIQGQLSTGSIIALVTYLTNLYYPLAALAGVYVELKSSSAIFARIFEFLDLRPEVEDKPEAHTITTAQGHVCFHDVSFSYASSPVQRTNERRPGEKGDGSKASFWLQDISFEMLPGERVALVGPSGAGKTTLTYLLPRFLDPVSGHISLDGHRLPNLSLESLRAQIGIVTQETFLFHSSVRDNLLYARPNATESEIVAAAQAAQIHDFVQSLPQGYDTVVGERAFRLSGGERQRLAIARALLKDPRILILDEATSHLDATSEHLVQQALETLLKGRTSLIVAHRLSTVASADKILVIEGGRLVESGRHAELLSQGGLYASLYRSQFNRLTLSTVADGEREHLGEQADALY